jgi:hypothetical protein
VLDLPFDLVRPDILMTRQPVPEESIIAIVDEVWLPLLGFSPGSDAGRREPSS